MQINQWQGSAQPEYNRKIGRQPPVKPLCVSGGGPTPNPIEKLRKSREKAMQKNNQMNKKKNSNQANDLTSTITLKPPSPPGQFYNRFTFQTNRNMNVKNNCIQKGFCTKQKLNSYSTQHWKKCQTKLWALRKKKTTQQFVFLSFIHHFSVHFVFCKTSNNKK